MNEDFVGRTLGVHINRNNSQGNVILFDGLPIWVTIIQDPQSLVHSEGPIGLSGI